MSNTEKVRSNDGESSSYPKIITNPLEGKKPRENPLSSKAGISPSLFFLILSFFKKFLSPVVSGASSFQSAAPLESILTNLSSFRKLLTMLAEEDLSYQTDFNYQIAKLWHILRDDCNNLPPNPSSPLIFERVKFLIHQIENFPIGTDYPLGYYLSKEIGSEWNPFPCMQLFKELHDEFIKAPLNSTLHNWILLIDDLFSQIQDLSQRTLSP